MKHKKILKKLIEHRKYIQSKRHYVVTTLTRGVYKLYNKGMVVYIGISKTNVMDRICAHHKDEEKSFDSFSFKDYNELTDFELENLETKLIKKYLPIYNKIHNNNKKIEEPYKPPKNKPKSRFKTETKSLRYSETVDGKKIMNRRSKK